MNQSPKDTGNSLALSVPLIACFLLAGCGRKNPVNEISVSESGIAITQPTTDRNETLHWSAWRGPSGDGQVPPQEIVSKWSETENVVWRTSLPGRGHSSPIVVGDSVYLVTALEGKKQTQMMAFDRSTGDVNWTTNIQKGEFPSQASIHRKATHANGTIACDGQRLYIANRTSDAVVASAVSLDGDIIWQKEIGKFVSKFGYAPSPVLYKSLVIFAADNMGGGYLAALDGVTGEIAWRIARGNGSSYSSAAIANVGGKDQLLISGNNAVASYDPATGDEYWTTSCVSEATCGTIVTSGDLIFASGGYPQHETVCLTADGNQKWSDKARAYEPSLVVVGDYLVMVQDDGIAQCWSAASGDVLWKKRLGGNFSSSPIVCNDLVYASNLDGNTFVFSCENDQYQLVAKNRLGDDCYASPAVAEGHLFYRIGVGRGGQRKEELVCIGVEVEQ